MQTLITALRKILGFFGLFVCKNITGPAVWKYHWDLNFDSPW